VPCKYCKYFWAASLVALNSFVEQSFTSGSTVVGLVMVAFYISLSISVFVFPQLGIRQRVRIEKSRVSGLFTQMLPSGAQTIKVADTNPERLAALMSSRAQIQVLPEWPVGQHTNVRLIAYLLVPLLSWSAAAMVEETVSMLLS
jgi:hypothetical protein